jgi:hypothetical protein
MPSALSATSRPIGVLGATTPIRMPAPLFETRSSF